MSVLATMKITPAENEDFQEIWEIILACKDHLISQNIFQWDEEYPKPSHIKNDIANGALVKYVLDGRIVGIISFDSCQTPEYQSVHWQFTTEPIAVIHRLAVHPKFQNNGFSSRLMEFAEKTIADTKVSSIRLDAYAGNPMLLEYYVKKGYLKAGEIYLFHKKLPFVCFEKAIQ